MSSTGSFELLAPPPGRRLAFISDLHLGADTPRTQAALEALLAPLQADALFVLGDLFEAWVGDDALALPYAQAVARSFQALRARGCALYFQHGNRDFLLGPAMAQACGFTLLPELVCLHALDRTWLLAHGDAQCVDDAGYQALRAQVRSAAWQQAFLARPLAERMQLAAQMRDASQRSQAAQRDAGLPFADPDATLCSAQLRQAGASVLIHGHTHRPGRFALQGGLAREVLCDWELDHGAPRGEIAWLTPDGLRREALSAAC